MARCEEPGVHTPRLLLRLPREGDVRALMELHEQPEVRKHLKLDTPATGLTVAWRNVALIIGHWHLRGYGHWVVIEKASDALVGRVGFYHPEGWPGIELGYVIAHSHWGRGFASEAAAAALDWGWTNIQTDHIISVIPPDNLASVRIATKLGMRFHRVQAQDGHDVHVYRIDRPH